MTTFSLSLCGPDPLNRVLRARLGVCGQVPVIILRIATASRKTCLPSMPCSDGSSQPVQTRAEGCFLQLLRVEEGPILCRETDGFIPAGICTAVCGGAGNSGYF